jgi:hypothetical protein
MWTRNDALATTNQKAKVTATWSILSVQSEVSKLCEWRKPNLLTARVRLTIATDAECDHSMFVHGKRR